MVYENETMMWVALGLAGLATLLMWQLGRGAKAKPTMADAPGGGAAGAGFDHLLLRFVHDASGERKGETVAVEGDQVIVKNQEAFFQVPANQLEESGAGLKIAGDLDWDAARRAGEAWRERSHKVIEYRPDEVPKDEP